MKNDRLKFEVTGDELTITTKINTVFHFVANDTKANNNEKIHLMISELTPDEIKIVNYGCMTFVAEVVDEIMFPPPSFFLVLLILGINIKYDMGTIS